MTENRRKTYLREWRKHRGLSLEKAAAHAGISHSTLGRIERGLVPYNQDLLENLAALYGCDPAELLIQEPGDGPNVIPIWRDADQAQRRAIASVAETITHYRPKD